MGPIVGTMGPAPGFDGLASGGYGGSYGGYGSQPMWGSTTGGIPGPYGMPSMQMLQQQQQQQQLFPSTPLDQNHYQKLINDALFSVGQTVQNFGRVSQLLTINFESLHIGLLSIFRLVTQADLMRQELWGLVQTFATLRVIHLMLVRLQRLLYSWIGRPSADSGANTLALLDFKEAWIESMSRSSRMASQPLLDAFGRPLPQKGSSRTSRVLLLLVAVFLGRWLLRRLQHWRQANPTDRPPAPSSSRERLRPVAASQEPQATEISQSVPQGPPPPPPGPPPPGFAAPSNLGGGVGGGPLAGMQNWSPGSSMGFGGMGGYGAGSYGYGGGLGYGSTYGGAGYGGMGGYGSGYGGGMYL